MRKQSLEEAVKLAESKGSRPLARAAYAMVGLPMGGWPDTRQARLSVREDLPVQSLRSYSTGEFVAAVYYVDQLDRYRSVFDVLSAAETEYSATVSASMLMALPVDGRRVLSDDHCRLRSAIDAFRRCALSDPQRSDQAAQLARLVAECTHTRELWT